MITRGIKPRLIIIEECNLQNWVEREQYYIKVYENLTNLTDGGEGAFGYKHTDEIKKLMSINRTGEKNGFYNKTHTHETKKFLSDNNKEYFKTHDNPFKNKKHNENTKLIISQITKKRWENGTLHAPPLLLGKDNPSSKKRIFLSPLGEYHIVYSTKKFCTERNLSYETIKKNINKGVIKLPEDIITLSRQRKKSLNTIGWEIIE
jgi:group I intron endonuclease